MKTILQQLRQFWQKDFHPKVYSCALLFISLAIFFNYQHNFEDGILDPLQRNWWAVGLYFLYFAIPYLIIIGLYWLFIPSMRQHIYRRRFWLKTWFALGLLAVKVWFFYHLLLSPDGQFQVRYLYSKLSNSFVDILIYTVGLVGFYRLLEVENKNVYGLATREFYWTPYALLLLFMLPLIAWAAFQPDFLESYPRLRPEYVKTNYWQWFSVYEPLYLGEFIALEWFFRGFLVVGMVQLIGHRAVLPMAIIYCVFHFGKPMGECIGSLFGGYILGFIAYSTRSVWGGIIVHMGVALLMDLFAILSLHFWQ